MFRVEPNADPSVAEAIYVEDGWQRVAGDVPFRLGYPGSSHFVARDDDGRPVGVASVVAYPPPSGYDRMGIAGGAGGDADGPAAFAWVAGMNVRESWRGRGVGRALLRACTDAARAAGASVIGLDATDAGRKLYLRAGFRDVGASPRWARGPGAPTPVAPEDDGGFSIHPTGTYEGLDLATYDAPRFGAQRGPLLADVLSRSKGAAFVAYERASGRLAGYVACDEWEIGPLVADHAHAARLLLHAALAAGAPPVARLWDANAVAAAVFGEAGFRPTGATCARMVLGGELPTKAETVFAIRGWAWG